MVQFQIKIEELAKVPYLDPNATPTMPLHLLPYWDGSCWHAWILNGDGTLRTLHPRDTAHGDYVAKEALRWLRDHGWIMTRVGSGATVADPLPESGRSLTERVAGVEERTQDQERRLAIVEDQLRRLLQAQRGQRADTTDHRSVADRAIRRNGPRSLRGPCESPARPTEAGETRPSRSPTAGAKRLG